MSLTYCRCGHVEDNDQHACPVTQKRLRQQLSLAEEGLANYAQEVERLRTALEGIKAFPVGAFRSLEDECAIWRIANEALNGVPQ